jgi:hypothetical protein
MNMGSVLEALEVECLCMRHVWDLSHIHACSWHKGTKWRVRYTETFYFILFYLDASIAFVAIF